MKSSSFVSEVPRPYSEKSPESYNFDRGTSAKPIAKSSSFSGHQQSIRAITIVSKRPSIIVANHCHHVLCCVLIAFCALFCFSSLSAQQSTGSSQPAPKLLEAIDDQTLFLNPQYVDSAGPVASQRIYLRDLHLSFGDSSDQKFSAYPYDKTVADAWIVENYLIVLAKSAGSAQIAVTASNGSGSMIDWFIVHVKERASEQVPNHSETDFQAEFRTVPSSYANEFALRLPELPQESAKYLISPELPSGLIYDDINKTIRGRVEGSMPSSTHYWIGVSDKGVTIQQFSFVNLKETKVEARKPITSSPILSFDESLSTPFAVDSTNSASRRISTSSRATTTETVAASRPMRPQSGGNMSVHQNLLYGVTSAMHSRFRDLSLHEATTESSTYTLWNYASTRYSANSSRTGVEPSGIYVGFDTKLEENLTTGLTIGFDNQGFTNASLRNSSGSPDRAGINLASILPYARWHDGRGAEVWGVLGVAKDLSEFDSAYAANSDLRNPNLLLGAVGWRQLLGSTGNLHIATVGDAGLTIPLRRDEPESNSPLLPQISSRSLRAGLEMSFSGEQVQPYVGLSGRVNSDSEMRDATLEALGGVRYTSLSGLTFKAEGRALSAQNVLEDPELVFSVAAHLDPGLRGEGLALSVAPMYGINRTGLPRTLPSTRSYSRFNDSSFDVAGENAWAMRGSLSYGLPVGSAGVITPFGQIAISTVNQTRMGVRVALNSNLDRLFNLEIATAQSRIDQQEFDKGVDIQLRLVF